MFLYCCRNRQTTAYLYTIAYQDDSYKVQDSSPKKDNKNGRFAIIGSEKVTKNDFNSNYDLNRSSESNMNSFIRYMATLDDSINDRIFTIKLKISYS